MSPTNIQPYNCKTYPWNYISTNAHLCICTNVQIHTQPILKTSKLDYYKTMRLHIHMCAQLRVLKIFGILTFLGYEFVGQLYPSRVTIGIHTLATSAHFHQCIQTPLGVSCGLGFNPGGSTR